MDASIWGLILLGAYLCEAMILGVANVVKTISFPTGISGSTTYYQGSVKADKVGTRLHYFAVILMVTTAIANQYVFIGADFGNEATFGWFAFFLLYLLGVSLGGHISYFIITRFFKVYADTGIVDEMVSC